MIEASTNGFAALARTLAARARGVAEAHVESAARERRRDPTRWRDARLLWPDTTQEP